MRENWRVVLIAALVVNAALGLGYRVYRRAKGGPISDVWGQAVLGTTLAGVAIALGAGAVWARWVALAYGLLYAVVVMPIWTLAVLIPLRPRWPDYTYTVVYWAVLALVVASSVAP